MATVIDLLQRLGKGKAPDGGDALAGHIVLPRTTVTPLPATAVPDVGQAWTEIVQQPILRHHAFALSAVQAGRSLALLGYGDAPRDDLTLVVLQRLLELKKSSLLYIVNPADETARDHLIRLASLLKLSIVDGEQPGGRVQPSVLVIATPETVHRRILRSHDRAWNWLWPRLRLIAMPHLQRYSAVETGHLHWLLRRIERLAAHAPLQICASLTPIADAESTLAAVCDRNIHTVETPHAPSHNTIVALWRCGQARTHTAVQLAAQLHAHRLTVTVLGRDAWETQEAQAALGADVPTNQPPDAARIAVLTGVPRTEDARQALIHAGYRLLILLAGNEAHELALANQTQHLHGQPVYLPTASANTRIAARHIACAAIERPLERGEIERWNSQVLHGQLVHNGTLQELPDVDLWQHNPDASDPYPASLASATGVPPVHMVGPDGEVVTHLSPALLDHCALPHQVIVPGRRVAHRDGTQSTIQLRSDPHAYLTLVSAQSSIHVRDVLDSCTVRCGNQIIELSLGDVAVDRTITELHDLTPAGARTIPVSPPTQIAWPAMACWFNLRVEPDDPHTAGWVLAQALPLLVHSATAVPVYDPEHRRLYLIEAEQGDTGVVRTVYAQFERLLEHTYALAQSYARHPIYRYAVASELAWLAAFGEHAGQERGIVPARAAIYPSASNVQAAGHGTPAQQTHADTAHRSEPQLRETPAVPEAFFAHAAQPDLQPSPDREPDACLQTVSASTSEDARKPSPAPSETKQPASPDNVRRQRQSGDNTPPVQPTDQTQSQTSKPAAQQATRKPALPNTTHPQDSAVQRKEHQPSRSQSPRAAAAQNRTQQRQDHPQAASQRKQSGQPESDDERPPDVAALIARMRRLREEQREPQPRPRQKPNAPDEPATPRFGSGERVQCLPYGMGRVQASWFVNGREHVLIHFDDYGDIEVDASLNLIRRVDSGNTRRAGDWEDIDTT